MPYRGFGMLRSRAHEFRGFRAGCTAMLSLALASNLALAAEPTTAPGAALPAATLSAADIERARAQMTALLEQGLSECAGRSLDFGPGHSAYAGAPQGSAMQPPRMLPGKISRDYPDSELRNGHQGIVIVTFLVDAYGNLRFAHNEVGIPDAEQRQYLAQSAVAGEHNAQLRVAQLLGASSCKLSPDVERLLHLQAWSGKSDLELIQGTHLLEIGDPARYHDVDVLLQGAAHGKDPFVQAWAAGLLATTPVAELRNPSLALEVARGLDSRSDPDTRELLAAALAANGQFEEAVRVETEAIRRVESLHWNSAPMQPRLARYQAGEPWIGYLCDCTSLVPGEGL